MDPVVKQSLICSFSTAFIALIIVISGPVSGPIDKEYWAVYFSIAATLVLFGITLIIRAIWILVRTARQSRQNA